MAKNSLLFLAVALTLGVILVNGWTDVPNAIATCVVTRCMSARTAKEMLAELPNFKKPKKLHNMIIALSHKEEAYDRLYLEATLKAIEFSSDPLTVIFWREILDKLESYADACEHVGDSIETIVMKNN